VAAPEATSVIVPAHNEAAAIGEVVSRLASAGRWHEILVVDDGSSDATGEIARAAGAVVIRHVYRKGNGAAIKTGLRRATGEFVLILAGDGQHAVEDSVRLVAPLGEYDLVVGTRVGSMQARWTGRLAEAALKRLASHVAGHPIPDLTSGFRAARRSALMQYFHLLPNGFSTAATTTLAIIKAGLSVSFEATAARPRIGAPRPHPAGEAARSFLALLWLIIMFSPLRIFSPVSAGVLALGAGYGLWTVATVMHVTNSSVLLIMLGVVVFLIGLISEQIAALRFEGRDL
jgi:glycosyltransferase involved in cell wall biosynthesis